MGETAWFRDWFGTRYYVLLYGHRDALEAKAWVDMLLERWHLGPEAHVLDLACGRGRHAHWFVQAGFGVTGVDIDARSIDQARSAVPQAVFKVHDMRTPVAHATFDASCCLFTSLGYFDLMTDDERVFQAAFTALRPGGRFVVDFMNTAKVLQELVGEEQVQRNGVRFRITRTLERGVIVKRIAVEDGGETHFFEERVQALLPEELDAMATRAGFAIEDRTDGPVPAPYRTTTSERYVLWLRKPLDA